MLYAIGSIIWIIFGMLIAPMLFVCFSMSKTRIWITNKDTQNYYDDKLKGKT
jgi:hypothetical protein